MYQLVEDLLLKGVPPNQILFFSFDLPGVLPGTADPLTEILRLYEERIVRRSFGELGKSCYVFLDEVTRSENWHRNLKGWYDLKLPLKFVVSSSSHAALKAGAAESLVGRLNLHLLLSWKFVDVLMFRTHDKTINDSSLDARRALHDSVVSGSLPPLLRLLQRSRPRDTRGRLAVESALHKYLLVDGMPSLFGDRGAPFQWARTLSDYLSLTLTNDVYRFFGIRSSTRVFEDLLSLIASQSGQIMSYRRLAETLGIELRTLQEYLDYLEGIFLVSRAQFYSKSRAVRSRKQRKIYLTNPAILNLLLGHLGPDLTRQASLMGPVAESVVHDHAKRLAFNFSPGIAPTAYYWRDDRGHEVDVVIDVDGNPLPIEVKFRADPKRDIGGVHAFLEKFNSEVAIVVTRDLLAVEAKIFYMPLADFLSLVTRPRKKADLTGV
jgi:predicted AAA+ superfamily ATPase